MHLASLLHAAACLVLRCDFDLDNLITFDPKDVSCNPPYPGFIYNSKVSGSILVKRLYLLLTAVAWCHQQPNFMLQHFIG